MLKNGVKAKMMVITPERAAKWLEAGEPNRKIKDAQLRRLVGVINRGEWDENNGETIKISPDGGVVDGQHRLWAIIETNKSVRALVAFNVPSDSFDTIDTGVGRSALDAIVVDGRRTGKEQKYSAYLAASAKLLYKLKQAGRIDRMLRSGGNMKVENKHVLKIVNDNPELAESTRFVGSLPHVKGIHKSIMIFLHSLFNKKHSDKAQRFFEKLYSGEDLSKGSPILALRNKLISLQGHRGAKNGHPFNKFVMAITIKAWNAYRQNRSAKILSWGAEEAPPVPR